MSLKHHEYYSTPSQAFFDLVKHYHTVNGVYHIDNVQLPINPKENYNLVFVLSTLSRPLLYLSTTKEYEHPVFRTLVLNTYHASTKLIANTIDNSEIFYFWINRMKPLVATGLQIFLPADTINHAIHQLKQRHNESNEHYLIRYNQLIDVIDHCIVFNQYNLTSDVKANVISDPKAEFLLRSTIELEDVLKTSKRNPSVLIDRLTVIMDYKTNYVALRKFVDSTSSDDVLLSNTIFNDVCELYAIIRDLQVHMSNHHYDGAALMAVYYINSTLLTIRCKYNDVNMNRTHLNAVYISLQGFTNVMDNENYLVRTEKQARHDVSRANQLLSSGLLNLSKFAILNGIQPVDVIARFNTQQQQSSSDIVVLQETDIEFDLDETTNQLTEKISRVTIEASAGKQQQKGVHFDLTP